MIALLAKSLAVAATFVVAAQVIPQVKVKNWGAAIGAGIVFGVANLLLGWLLGAIFGALLFIPKILTLGLAGLAVPILINSVLLKLTDDVVEEDLVIQGIPTLVTMATAISVISFGVGLLF